MTEPSQPHAACRWHNVRIKTPSRPFEHDRSRPNFLRLVRSLMNLISFVTDKTEELLGHSPHSAIVGQASVPRRGRSQAARSAITAGRPASFRGS